MSHGGNIRQLRLKSKTGEVIDFSASINPLGAPEWMQREVCRALEDAAYYPDVDCHELLAAAEDAFELAQDSIIACNGTSEVLFQLPRLGNFRKAYIPAPAYIDYQRACGNAGVEIEQFMLADSEGGFAYPTPQELAKKVDLGSLIFICSPLNPCGISVPPQYFHELAALCPNSTIIADAAYWDFLHGVDYGGRHWLKELPENVIVLWSMTKFYSMPGLRLGFCFGHGELFKKLKRALPPWNVSTISQFVGTRALKDDDFAARTIQTTIDTYEDFFNGLSSIEGLRPLPSHANFIFCELTSDKFSAKELTEKLIERGMAVRPCGDFSGLSGEWLRMAVRTTADNQKLLEAMDQILNPHKPAKPAKNTTPALMLLGTCSNAGKSVLASALCRIFKEDGIKVAPFKAQNMALNSYVVGDGLEIGHAQATQAFAAGLQPDVRMNPVLLKPNSDIGSQVIINGQVVKNMKVREYVQYKDTAFKAVKEAYNSLADEYDAIILEGAGSPGEINLKAHDIVNTRMAQYANASALLVGDIDRGGVYASFIGTYLTLLPWERELLKGFIVNRFRGDATLLADAHTYLKEFTGRDVMGVVPFLHNLNLPQEDSVSLNDHFRNAGAKHDDAIDIAVIATPAMANYTDLDPLMGEPDVHLRLVRSGAELGRPDAVILAGSKNVLADLAFMENAGLDRAIKSYAQNGGSVCGICGGLQIMGRTISDPHEIEGGGSARGLELLAVDTIFKTPKILKRNSALHLPSQMRVTGFEMHNGRTDFAGLPALFVCDDKEVLGVGDERIWATYLHGVFDADEFRRNFIDTLRIKKGLASLGKILYHYNYEQAFNNLAKVVRASLEMDKIYAMAGL